ncbi:GAF domain-containing protein, partial [Patescibacteria group bacterium]|nr:GAF domain-containing protein [Patescibacteria group bacterium]
AIFVFFLGFFVFLRNRKERINFTFFLHAIAISLWLFGTFMMFINRESRDLSIFWDRFIYGSVVFIPAFMYHFGLAYSQKKPDFLLKLGYVLSFVFLFLVPTKYFVDDLFVYQWGVHTKAQFFHHIFLVYFVSYVVIWFVKMFLYYKSLRVAILREQAKYIFIAFLVLFSIGPMAYLPAYGLGIYPFAYISGLLFSVILAYAIIVHRLMDIKLALRRSFVYIFSVLAIIIPAFPALYYLDKFFPQYIIYVSLVISALAVLVFTPIRNYYYRIANKYFFSSLYDSNQVIAKLSDGLRSTLDIQQAYNLISDTLINSLRVKSVAVLNYQENNQQYLVQYNNGFDLKDQRFFPSDADLHRNYIIKSVPVVVEELRQTDYQSHKAILDLLLGLKVAMVIPLNIQNETLGIIALGQKESGDMYNEEDLKTLEVIASQAAIAIKNAQLYDETKRFSQTLQAEVERQTKELKRANEDLQKLDKAKSDFISIASHQLRTPLTAIKGFTSMILEGNYGQLTDILRDKEEKILESAERLIKLVNDLLNLSHMEGGEMEFNFAKVDFDAMVKSVAEELAPTAEKKKLKFTWQTPDKEFWVRADEQKLRQVVMNLIDNAIKYTQKGRVEVLLEQQDKNIVMAVRDTGMGLQPGESKHLFQKFMRGAEASHYHTEGAGIGLYVARQLIEAHQGRVWAESEGEGKGSTFLVELAEWKE